MRRLVQIAAAARGRRRIVLLAAVLAAAAGGAWYATAATARESAAPAPQLGPSLGLRSTATTARTVTLAWRRPQGSRTAPVYALYRDGVRVGTSRRTSATP